MKFSASHGGHLGASRCGGGLRANTVALAAGGLGEEET
jgi:hypothetical protein